MGIKITLTEKRTQYPKLGFILGQRIWRASWLISSWLTEGERFPLAYLLAEEV